MIFVHTFRAHFAKENSRASYPKCSETHKENMSKRSKMQSSNKYLVKIEQLSKLTFYIPFIQSQKEKIVKEARNKSTC